MRASLPDSLLRYDAEINVSFSSGENTPFWLVNNRFGLSSIEKNNGYVRAGLFKDIRMEKKRFSWGAGVDLAAAWNFTSPFVVQQLYGEISYWNGKLTIGSKERTELINDPKLSSGNLLFSPNARPIPQARIELPDYIEIPGLNKWFAIKGYFSFGMFTDDNWQRDFTVGKNKHTENVLFHSKGGFIRVGDLNRFPVVGEAGLEMAAQFGGKSISGDKVINMPHSIKDWWHIIIPSGGGSDTPLGEQTNIYGNHVGEWVFTLSYLPQDKDISVKAYYEHYFEDHSMMFFDYKWRDMLLGLQMTLPKNPVIKGFVYEYLYTKDQAAPVYWDHTPEIPEQVSGRDEYYNHGIYTGWQHWGMGIGNPLLISPIYNRNGSIYFNHNRLEGHHLGIIGSPIPLVDYRILLSYTKSWGTYNNPTSKVLKNFNTLFEATIHPTCLKGWQGTLSIATDGGSLLGPSFGVMFSIRKTGWL
ncbi:MAG: hypothetical protein J1E38_10240 [Paramuribaculum sp.]|nr:hypothetical protein [Paramuribaculum sp.]